MKPKHQRLIFLLISMMFLCAAALMTLRAFRDNLVFFYSPSDVAEHKVEPGKLIRIGGLVKTGSIEHPDAGSIAFDVTDGKADIHITYKGIAPNLFRDGQGIVAEGTLTDPVHFTAKTLLAKHDENYMPREVVDALKRSGQWKGQ